MRVSTGNLKGRRIKFPKGIRPTQQKIRKAIFDILGDEVRGSRFLELFAGSGAVGIEALSNGAHEVVFVESSRKSTSILKSNIEYVDMNNYDIMPIDVLKAIGRLRALGKTFDIVFLDPPYFKELAQKTLQKISMCDILNPLGIIVAEHHKRESLDKQFSDITLFKQRRYGDTCLSFYKIQ